MIRKALFTLSILPFALITPVLEISPTHVFNPDWPGHARLHDVWQLITHCALAAYMLWLFWSRKREREACLVALIVVGGFLAAYLLSPLYGGSMSHSDDVPLTFAAQGAVIVMGVAAALQVGLLMTAERRMSA